MNYRNTLVILLAITLVPLALSAQPQGSGRGQGNGDTDWQPGYPGNGHSDRGLEQKIERLIEFLDLSDAQTVQIEEIMAAQKEERQRARQSMRTDGDALRALIDSESPDPALVGQKVLAMHAAKEAMRTQGATDRESIRDVLTPEQAEKFDVLMEAREMRGDRDGRRRPGRRGPRTGARGQRAPGDG